MSRLTRAQAVELVGKDVVAKVEAVDVDFTGRATEGSSDAGYTEFSASCKTDDLEITMYVMVDSDAVAACDDLSQIDWDAPIANARFAVL
jgi:hypothetical protein